MSFKWMRRIDTWAGKPVTWLLGILTRRSRSLYGDVHPESVPRRVICTKFIGLGSVVLSLPLLKALKEQGVEIAFWSFPGQGEIARLSGLVDHVWIVKPRLFSLLPTLWKTWRQARRFRADAFLDLEPTANFTAILGRLSGAPLRVGFMSAKPVRERIFTHLVAQAPERHMVDNCLWMGRLLGVPADARRALPAPPAALPPVSASILPPPAPGARRIVLNINSSELSWHRMWPDEHWIALISKFHGVPGAELVFPGSPEERPRVERLLARLGGDPFLKIHNVAGRTSLPDLLGVLRSADLVVSIDSGIMHLAAWMGVPVLGLFGPETPRLFAPHSPRAKVLWAALPCSPCLSVAADKITRCQDNQCMKRVAPGHVFSAARLLLETSRPAAPAPTVTEAA